MDFNATHGVTQWPGPLGREHLMRCPTSQKLEVTLISHWMLAFPEQVLRREFSHCICVLRLLEQMYSFVILEADSETQGSLGRGHSALFRGSGRKQVLCLFLLVMTASILCLVATSHPTLPPWSHHLLFFCLCACGSSLLPISLL